ncbi:MAG: transposase [Isosphaeraceae bacterium]|nr:transposase [Isosphaeraceae bacterium]
MPDDLRPRSNVVGAGLKPALVDSLISFHSNETQHMVHDHSVRSHPRISLHGIERLQGYDYSQSGAYFLTLCVNGRSHLFGEVLDATMHLNHFGRIVQTCWTDLSNHYRHISLDAFTVMPNHIHGILFLERGPTTEQQHGVPEIVRALKTFSARRINEQRGSRGSSVWQRNYFEHIIRDERALDRIREYILDNPRRWSVDRENTLREGHDEFDRWIESFPAPAKHR